MAALRSVAKSPGHSLWGVSEYPPECNALSHHPSVWAAAGAAGAALFCACCPKKFAGEYFPFCAAWVFSPGSLPTAAEILGHLFVCHNHCRCGGADPAGVDGGHLRHRRSDAECAGGIHGLRTVSADS